MSTIQIQNEWQPLPSKNLVLSTPVKKGEIFQIHELKCTVCSSVKTPYILAENGDPLVLRCIKCGHKSWANTLA